MLTDDEKDTVVRILNNAAAAKKFIREGEKEKALQYIDYSLSWSIKILGVDHPAFEANNNKLLTTKDLPKDR